MVIVIRAATQVEEALTMLLKGDEDVECSGGLLRHRWAASFQKLERDHAGQH